MKTFLSIVTFIVFSFVSAQEDTSEKLLIEKGTRTITGSASLYTQNDKSSFNQTDNAYENSLNGFIVAPSFGYAIKNNLIIGLGLRYDNYKNENSSGNFKYINESVGINPYLRGYKGIGKQLSLYLQGEVGYGRFWNKNEQSNQGQNDDSNGNNLYAAIRPGITYFLGKKLAVEASYGSLSYSYQERKFDSGDYTKTNNFRLDLNPSNLLFGLAYYF